MEIIKITDNLELHLKSKSEDIIIAELYTVVYRNEGGGQEIKYMADLVGFMNNNPTLEDAKKYYSIKVYQVYDTINEQDCKLIIQALLENKLVNLPVRLGCVRIYPYEPDKDFIVQEGKIFPDDTD